MMAPPCIPQCFLNQRRSLWLLSLLLTTMWLLAVTETTAPIQFRGEVGGNVTIHCPFAKKGRILFFYFQRGGTFVNGYHAMRNKSEMVTWENTRVDDHNTTVYIFNLNISHNGVYQCHIQSFDNDMVTTTDINLTVTANYSQPEAKVQCRNGFGCLVTCASHGGYPGNTMRWSVPENHTWTIMNSSEMNDAATMTVNSSSTAYFNCSSGQLDHLRCSVGQVTSELFSVCNKPEDPPEPDNTFVIQTAICAVLIFSIIVVLLLFWSCRKGRTGEADTVVRLERNERPEEATALSETTAGMEASGVPQR